MTHDKPLFSSKPFNKILLGTLMKNRPWFWLMIVIFILYLSGCAHYTLVRQSPPVKNGYLIRDVSVFTALPENPVLVDRDVYIQGETIAMVSEERLNIPGAEVIDGRGKMLLPGLIDFHTHITSGMIIPWGDIIPTMHFNMEGCL